MAMCIYCGERVGIVCDSCAGTARERDELKAELARLRELCANRPSLASAMLNRPGAMEELNLWIGQIDAAGREEG